MSFYRETRKKRLLLLWRIYVSVALVEEGEDPPTGPPTFVFRNRKEYEEGQRGGRKQELPRSSRTVGFYNLSLVIYCLLLNRKDVKVALWKEKKLRGTNTNGMLMRILCNRMKMPGRRFPYGVLTGGSQGHMVRVL